ncbi:lactoylglutathione lyase [Biscogniauxia marginata]|nr:lactoylglutathione lyase [Biscogniauxia marginata]
MVSQANDGPEHPGAADAGLSGNPQASNVSEKHEPTAGYRMNHVMLRIRDPEPSLDFYIRLMGMKMIFTANTGPFTIYYLGYPQSSEHRADPESFARDVRSHSTLTRTLGLLELCHYHGSELQPSSYTSTGNDPPHLGFNHLGFTVPNVKEAVTRLKEAGMRVVKEVQGGPIDGIPITQWEKEKGIATAELSHHFENIFRQIAFVQDPDGYLVELVPNDLEE